jgi:biotin synthase
VTSELPAALPDWLRARGAAQAQLQERAAAVARAQFGRRVFVRAVVEVSNHCRENCAYCGMRRDNRDLDRFRARHEELAELLIHHRPGCVTDVNIQAGEDPVAVREVVLPLLRTLRRETSLGLSVCLGTLSPGLYAELQSAGASVYILKFELAEAAAYQALGAPGTLEERVQHLRHLAASGWHVSSGFIAGLPGQAEEGLAANFALAAGLPLSGCSVSPFIPGEATPLRGRPGADLDLALNCMAALRLVRPHWVIPAVSALQLAGSGEGYERGLAMGANLVTINLTPSSVRTDYLLYRRDRQVMTEERVLGALGRAGLEASEQSLASYWDEARAGAGGGSRVMAAL